MRSGHWLAVAEKCSAVMPDIDKTECLLPTSLAKKAISEQKRNNDPERIRKMA